MKEHKKTGRRVRVVRSQSGGSGKIREKEKNLSGRHKRAGAKEVFSW